MISVVVPTIWAYEPFLDFLQYVVELPVIGEVILINNLIDKTPTHQVLEHHKVRHIKMNENIYVNPAWNLGAALSVHDTICILSDDVTVDLRVFFEADKFVSKEIGMLCIGTDQEVYNLHQKRYNEIKDLSRLSVTGNVKINSFSNAAGVCGAGTLFFIHKENWIDIPDQFKVNFGDTWQMEMQTRFGRETYFINDCFYYTPYSVSINTGIAMEYQTSQECIQYENMEYLYSLAASYKI
jgi:hypothetical protein